MACLSSIGIIGGADGPTAVFVTGGFPWTVAIAAGIAVAAWIFFRTKRK